MKVAILTHYYLPGMGGVETMSSTLAHCLAHEHGHDVTVITATAQRVPDEEMLGYVVLRAADSQTMVAALSEVDVIILNSGFPELALVLTALGTPRIRVLHSRDDNFPKGEPLKLRLWRFVQLRSGRWWMHRSHRLVAVSDYLRVQYKADLTIHNGYDDTVFYQTVPPEERDPLTLVTVGRLHPEKGVDLAIRAVALLWARGVPVRLRVAGEGRHRGELQTLARDLGVAEHVTFLGQLHPTEVNRVLNESAILIMPTRVPEAFGLAIVEAQAAGCAVVASDCGGIPEAMGGRGLMFPPGDASALADRVEALVRSDTARWEAVPPPEEMVGRNASAMADAYAREMAALIQKAGTR